MSKPKKSNTMFPRDDENFADPKGPTPWEDAPPTPPSPDSSSDASWGFSGPAYPIEPPAELPRIRRKRDSQYPFDGLTPAILEGDTLVGSYFRVAAEDKKKAARAASYAGRSTGRKFAIRDIDDAWVGVWRLE